MENILSDILESEASLCHITSIVSDEKLFQPLFSLNTKRKRNAQEFLDDYNKKHGTIVIDNDEPPEYQHSPELKLALRNLSFKIDPFFQKRLKLHQVEGLKFMWERVYEKKQGCLLAHSMGLGKTIQVISLLTTMYQHLKEKPETKFPTGNRVLILTPMVTLSNWANEFDKWAVDGVENVIGEVYNVSEMRNHKVSRMKYIKYWYTHGGVMLVNYDQFRSLLTAGNINDRESYYHYLVNPGPDVIILDEAHRIKNSSSVLSALVNKIRTRSRICLTGYPLQNRLLEYYYMVDFIAPGLLGSKEKFDCYFGNYIDKCYANSSTTTKEQANFKLYVLQLLTAHVTHRRDDYILVKDLPPKTEYVVRFKLSPIQHKGYTSLLKLSCFDNPMVALLILRSICNHPKIFQNFLAKRLERKRKVELNKLNAEENDDEEMIDDVAESMDIDEDVSVEKSFEEMNDTLDTDLVEVNEEAAFSILEFSEYEWTKDYLDDAGKIGLNCGKISFVADLAKECKLIGEKIVLVSHSLACLDYIQHLLPIFGIKTGRLDGSMMTGERQEVIDNFHTDESINVMLLSARASAIGINIVAANRIVLMDQDWNPLFDEQSIGRVYRYGQTKPVMVYRLITATTIEERIYKQGVHKKSIFRRVIDNKQSAVISREELVRYFQEPDSDLGLIDLETQPSRSDMDWISNRVLEQNANTITEFHQYKDDNNSKDMGESSLTESLRSRAKQDAISIIREWKNDSRLNM
ncbi:hypothetical protein HPULCUR_001045 [Helicostylum pulchrum]|uniref:Uncharacterized protein n=1 Tax=Helicostylum pulchrum TaxID=562976 RepID=A0ABP9XNG7_9FUNG